MTSATTPLIKPLRLSIPKCCISTLTIQFFKASPPLLSLPSKSITQIHLSSSSSSSWVFQKPKNSRSILVPLVAQTSDWAQQEEEAGEERIQLEANATEGEVEEEGESGAEKEEEDSYPEPPEEAKLFVGNLPYHYDSAKLAELFNQAGVVEIAEVSNLFPFKFHFSYMFLDHKYIIHL